MQFSYGLDGHFLKIYYSYFSLIFLCITALALFDSPSGGKEKARFAANAAAKTEGKRVMLQNN